MVKKLNFVNSKIITSSPEETIKIGKKFAEQLKAGSCILLIGEVGSGKTTFVKGVAQGLGFKNALNEVASPTFTLLREYPCKIPLFHADMYRLNSSDEDFQNLIDECLLDQAILMVEWPDSNVCSGDTVMWKVNFSYHKNKERQLHFQSNEKYSRI